MPTTPHIMIRGDRVRVGDTAAATFLDPYGQCVAVGATVHVERIQLFDPLTGVADPRVWLRRVGPMESVNGPAADQPVWEIRAANMYSFAHVDAVATSEPEFDALMAHFMPDA